MVRVLVRGEGGRTNASCVEFPIEAGVLTMRLPDEGWDVSAKVRNTRIPREIENVAGKTFERRCSNRNSAVGRAELDAQKEILWNHETGYDRAGHELKAVVLKVCMAFGSGDRWYAARAWARRLEGPINAAPSFPQSVCITHHHKQITIELTAGDGRDCDVVCLPSVRVKPRWLPEFLAQCVAIDRKRIVATGVDVVPVAGELEFAYLASANDVALDRGIVRDRVHRCGREVYP